MVSAMESVLYLLEEEQHDVVCLKKIIQATVRRISGGHNRSSARKVSEGRVQCKIQQEVVTAIGKEEGGGYLGTGFGYMNASIC